MGFWVMHGCLSSMDEGKVVSAGPPERRQELPRDRQGIFLTWLSTLESGRYRVCVCVGAELLGVVA